MTRIFTLIFLLVSYVGLAQETHGLTGKITGLNIQKTDTGTRIRMRCYSTLKPGQDLLLIVEGRKMALGTLSSLNPNDIASVTILKNAEASAIYGSEAVNGVILIDMKRNPFATIAILDAKDKSPVQYATVTFLFPGENDTLRYIADSTGKIETNSAQELIGRKMVVSAIGYKSEELTWNPPGDNLNNDVFLERDVVDCGNVVISTIVCYRIIRCYNGCSKFLGCEHHKLKTDPEADLNTVSIYPNPVRRGEQITVSISEEQARGQISLVSQSGTVITTQIFDSKNNGRMILQIPATLSAGIYYLRISYENGRQPASAKVIIQ